MKSFLLRATMVLVTLISTSLELHAGLNCYGLTDDNRIIHFDTDTPSTATYTNITGLPSGFTAVGMSIRITTETTANPGLGSIWIVACNDPMLNDYRLYVVNRGTGAASQISVLGALGTSPGISGWALGFNPATDRFQFLGEKLNYQINPNDGSVRTDTFFAGAPAYSGAAFTTAPFGGVSQFYDIDCGAGPPDTLQTSANISAGSLSVVGSIGIDVARPVGLAISNGSAFMAYNGNLYTINLSTGALGAANPIMGSPTLYGLAILPATFPQFTVTAKIKGKKRVTTTSATRKIKGTASSGSGIKLVQYKVGKGKFKKASGTTNWKFQAKLKPGVNVISVKATGGNGIVSPTVKVKVVRVLTTS